MVMTACWRAARRAVAALVLMASPALAQVSTVPPLSESADRLVLDAAGHRLTIPLPDWLDANQRQSGAVAAIETHYLGDAGEATLEIYRKGEIRALWTTLYGAHVTLSTDSSLANYRELIMALYGSTCRRELTGFFQIGQDQGDLLAPLGFVCGAYADRLAAYRGEGEVMVASFRKTDQGIAMVYQEWRGPAFDPADQTSWPVAAAVVQARAEQLQSETTLTVAQ